MWEKIWGCKNYRNHYEKGCGFFKLVDEEQVDEWDLLYSKAEECIGDNKDMVEEVHYFWISMFWVVPCIWYCTSM
ncbi:transmembrane protein, putative [Medicago truncatula]|uniref:Transmembrane protein, putative n=1 Tax=Medicago truncatula TaxID=3880 RepID=A0A072VHH8_MEDTR|nr:transmembrane protein, putative [Medicago truncatula]